MLRLDRLKTTAEARRAKATGGHLPSTATTNTMDVSYLHYPRHDPVIRAWAEDIIDAALADAEDSARNFQVRILGPQIHDHFRADPDAAARELGTTPARLGQALTGTLDTLAASCLDIDHSPFSSGRCTASFLMCLPQRPGAGTPPADAVCAAGPAAGRPRPDDGAGLVPRTASPG